MSRIGISKVVGDGGHRVLSGREVLCGILQSSSLRDPFGRVANKDAKEALECPLRDANLRRDVLDGAHAAVEQELFAGLLHNCQIARWHIKLRPTAQRVVEELGALGVDAFSIAPKVWGGFDIENTGFYRGGLGTKRGFHCQRPPFQTRHAPLPKPVQTTGAKLDRKHVSPLIEHFHKWACSGAEKG